MKQLNNYNYFYKAILVFMLTACGGTSSLDNSSVSLEMEESTFSSVAMVSMDEPNIFESYEEPLYGTKVTKFVNNRRVILTLRVKHGILMAL